MKNITLAFLALILSILALVSSINDQKELPPTGELPIQKVIIVTDSNLPKTNFNFTPINDRMENSNLPAIVLTK
jgi:hypothetical protein